MPPAVEIARSSGRGASSAQRQRLDRARRARPVRAARMSLRLAQQADGERAEAGRLAQRVASDSPARSCASRAAIAASGDVGAQVDRQRRRARRPRWRRAAAPTAHRPRRLRCRSRVTTASPRTVRPGEATARRSSAARRRSAAGTARSRRPRSRNWPAAAAQLRRRAAARISTQPPSEPSCGQLAPPSASTVASGAAISLSPSGGANASAPVGVPADPSMAQREPHACARAGAARRAAAARPSARLGKTRPLEPTKVSWPRPRHQARSAAGGNASIAGRSQAPAAP